MSEEFINRFKELIDEFDYPNCNGNCDCYSCLLNTCVFESNGEMFDICNLLDLIKEGMIRHKII